MQSAGLFSAALIAIGTIWGPEAAEAQDASWGCQVLLCAASQNPSWHGVSYCVPPMTKLISEMAKPGFNWPICKEGKAGKPGFERFENCPEGYKPASDNNDRRSGSNGVANRCEKVVNVCRNPKGRQTGLNYRDVQYRQIGGGDHGNTCTQVVSIARPMRKDPYFFDISNDQGAKQRVWFNLDR
ncbi:hypothetical protein [Mesorhizobium sp.]|uniref:hypothetical protein n=1 Tax=Mesorhizobium sp. TaxID=1871066 RepID=UPI0012211135|nr:hypothetical protein [Mesorhizobium sp.]TIV60198.1 MAG: hypothetical protein E5V80_10440 [Mesorhizobium sp.]